MFLYSTVYIVSYAFNTNGFNVSPTAAVQRCFSSTARWNGRRQAQQKKTTCGIFIKYLATKK